jgi:hypothetical protein
VTCCDSERKTEETKRKRKKEERKNTAEYGR